MFKTRNAPPAYDSTTQVPVLKKSICTGETTAGFKDRATGQYREVALIQSPADLRHFMRTYGITTVPQTEY